MNNGVRRIFVEKKPPFDVEAKKLQRDLVENLLITSLEQLRLVNRYDISGISDHEYNLSKYTIFSERTVDNVFEETLPADTHFHVFAIEYIPGQYDMRAESASECIQLLTQGKRPIIRTAKIILLYGDINNNDINRIKAYLINPVDSREASLHKPSSLETRVDSPSHVKVVENFIEMESDSIEELYSSLGLAMTLEDFIFCRDYFKNTEKRNPTFTEIKVIDTYWSDHCRHTTFLTEIKDIAFEDGRYVKVIENAYKDYMDVRNHVYEGVQKPVCLMDIAVIGMKELKERGLLKDLDLSDEINACSIKVPVDVDGSIEDWLVMFKNETHNHPTEIEPFGGAATCLGGAIRDPLSGRTYVYQAMRLTGSGDPRSSIEDTLHGKLPQRKITTEAAHGYSSYGNQIGLATGFVKEVYDKGFIAKRMEVGAVIAAAPAYNVVRATPAKGDKVILIGGQTGRDGCGGATGSSKQHNEESIYKSGAEVQKGNAPTERKLQRLFRNSKASRLIKRCNDFGAGGIAVAIGELADGLCINLDTVPKKYEGLDGTEIAISESQERMAVVVSEDDAEVFIKFAMEENLKADVVAEVTDNRRLIMFWKGSEIVNISRDFLNTNGAKSYIDVTVEAPDEKSSYFSKENEYENIIDKWRDTLSNINVCSQKGLIERFDSTIGAGTVLMPFGGRYQLTPSEGMAAKIPVISGKTSTGTLMSCGYDPEISKWSPFHGAVYAIVEATARITAMGGDYRRIRLSLQEYFEKLGKDRRRWGKPFAALLGALHVQKELGIAAIGGKDSMSGSFNELSVPPTLAGFAVCPIKDCSKVISQEFKSSGSMVVILHARRTADELPDFEILKDNFLKVNELIGEDKVLSAISVKNGGICEAISKMCFGNKIGFNFPKEVSEQALFSPDYGSIILELVHSVDIESEFTGLNYGILGTTTEKPMIMVNSIKFSLDTLIDTWQKPLESVFPSKTVSKADILKIPFNTNYNKTRVKSFSISCTRPRVFLPVFPGTNCEYDSTRAFEKAGALTKTLVFRNLSPLQIEESVKIMEKEIKASHIIMLSGGFSSGDEPEGSGKFIATAFRNPRIKDAVMEFLDRREGLILGICNGFQALIKLGLLPYGEIRDTEEDSPTLTYNEIGRHVSCMVSTKIVSTISPWLSSVKVGDIHTIPVSHGEGRFVGSENNILELFKNGQVAAQYVDHEGNPSLNMPYNPNGSFYAIEAVTSPDGRVLGKMAHSERIGSNIYRNIYGEMDQKLFESGVSYFK